MFWPLFCWYPVPFGWAVALNRCKWTRFHVETNDLAKFFPNKLEVSTCESCIHLAVDELGHRKFDFQSTSSAFVSQRNFSQNRRFFRTQWLGKFLENVKSFEHFLYQSNSITNLIDVYCYQPKYDTPTMTRYTRPQGTSIASILVAVDWASRLKSLPVSVELWCIQLWKKDESPSVVVPSSTLAYQFLFSDYKREREGEKCSRSSNEANHKEVLWRFLTCRGVSLIHFDDILNHVTNTSWHHWWNEQQNFCFELQRDNYSRKVVQKCKRNDNFWFRLCNHTTCVVDRSLDSSSKYTGVGVGSTFGGIIVVSSFGAIIV